MIEYEVAGANKFTGKLHWRLLESDQSINYLGRLGLGQVKFIHGRQHACVSQPHRCSVLLREWVFAVMMCFIQRLSWKVPDLFC